jgi:hypothetical protein
VGTHPAAYLSRHVSCIVYASEKRIAGRIRIQEAAAVWLILFFIACAVVYSVGKLIYQFWT